MNKVLHAIIPQALSGKELLKIIQNTIHNNDYELNAHTSYDTLEKNNMESIEWNGVIHIIDNNTHKSQSEKSFQINFKAYDIDSFASELNNIYPHERTIISISSNNNRSIDLVNTLIEDTGGYLVYDNKSKAIHYPVTSVLSPICKRKDDLFNMQKDLSNFFEKNKHLFTKEIKEILLEDFNDQLMEHVIKQPKKH